MAQKVTYQGARGRGVESNFVVIDGVELQAGVETEVPDELAGEIAQGSDRLSGYKFDVGTADGDDETKES